MKVGENSGCSAWKHYHHMLRVSVLARSVHVVAIGLARLVPVWVLWTGKPSRYI